MCQIISGRLKNVGVDIQASMLTQATVTKCLRQGKVKQQESVVDSSEFQEVEFKGQKIISLEETTLLLQIWHIISESLRLFYTVSDTLMVTKHL